eukprot:jgi/Ulvmu1/6107/UM027_0085.1
MLVDTKAVVAKLNWAILPICCVMIGCCYLDRSNVAYMQLQLRRPPPIGMGFSPSLYGNASGLFFLGYSVCQIPSNMILARLGAPLWLAVIVTLWGCCAMLLAAVRGAGQFLLLRVLLGVLEAGTFPGIWYHMTLFYPTSEITVPLSVTKSAIMVSQMLSAPVAAGLIALDGRAGLRGWQWLALGEGGATAAVGMVLKFLLPRTPGHMKSLSPEEAAWVNSHTAKPPTGESLLCGMRYAVGSHPLWLLTAVYTAKSCAAYSLIFWTPLVISDLLNRGAAPGAAATAGTAHDLSAVLLTAVPYAFAAVASYAIGWSSHAWDERKAHTYVPFAVGAAVLLAAPLLQGPGSAVPAFIALCVALCTCNATGPLTAAVVACLPRDAQPGGLALWNSVACVGGYLGPALFGWLKGATDSNAPGMVVLGCVLAAGAALMATFDERAAVAQAQGSCAASAAVHEADMSRLLPEEVASHRPQPVAAEAARMGRMHPPPAIDSDKPDGLRAVGTGPVLAVEADTPLDAA